MIRDMLLNNLIIFASLMLLMACNSSTSSQDVNEGEEQIVVKDSIKIQVDASDKIPISPNLFGVNNDWRQITDGEFPSFISSLKDISFDLMRYPGGWESEHYNWDNNTTPGWDKSPEKPGASVSTLMANVDSYSIVLPTLPAMNQALGTSTWEEKVAELEQRAEKAIYKVGATNVAIVEIGNEWWLQWGGGVSREKKLVKYVKIAMNIAEHIEQQFPDREFKLLVNGDYTKPGEFTTMKQEFAKAYEVIDGVALHTYTGYDTNTHHIDDLSARIKACANNFNAQKDFIYLSEWMPSRDYNNRKLYMEAANLIPDIFHIYARSGTDAAAYWPPVNTSIPGLGLLNNDFSTKWPVGQIFGDLSESYHGHAVKTTSPDSILIAGALQSSDQLVLYVPGKGLPPTQITISVDGFASSSVESAVKFRPADYSNPGSAEPYITENASSSVNKSANEIEFNINRDGEYEIFKIVLTK